MKRTALVLLCALVAVPAMAQEAEQAPSAGGGSRVASVLSGRTLKRGTVFHGEVGWPALSAGILTAATDRFDLGGRFSFMYGYEGITALGTVPGLKLQGIARLGILERGKLNLGVRFEPGVFFYFFRRGSPTEIGVALPFAVDMGLNLSPKLMLNFGLEIPMFVVFGPYGGLAVPVLVGGGVEYALDSELALTLNMKVGPSVALTGYQYDYGYFDRNYWCQDSRGNLYRCGAYYSYAAPAMELMVGITYRL